MEMRTGKGVAGGLGGSEKKGNPQIPTLLVCFYVCVCTDGLVRTGGSSVSVCLAADDYRTFLAIFHGLREWEWNFLCPRCSFTNAFRNYSSSALLPDE